MDEFRNQQEKLKGFSFRYIKGLGTLTKNFYFEMLQQPYLHRFTKDEAADLNIKNWFGKGIAQERKSMLKSEV